LYNSAEPLADFFAALFFADFLVAIVSLLEMERNENPAAARKYLRGILSSDRLRISGT
jgi:hypothetical protein